MTHHSAMHMAAFLLVLLLCVISTAAESSNGDTMVAKDPMLSLTHLPPKPAYTEYPNTPAGAMSANGGTMCFFKMVVEQECRYGTSLTKAQFWPKSFIEDDTKDQVKPFFVNDGRDVPADEEWMYFNEKTRHRIKLKGDDKYVGANTMSLEFEPWNGRFLMFHNAACAWDEFRKYENRTCSNTGRVAWCNRGDWTEGDSGWDKRMKDGCKGWAARNHMMDCWFECKVGSSEAGLELEEFW
ncbi:hypothetical protein BS50DRAFT_621812 [Corynespora cassiicola Philippines]|uniref:Uncharacterized protein n=1 Tax=Corynespora cassiicola Philippines TaxID=1448308 RepID=A0A2T2NKV1_CORCC|nr:hypothetical protein BS50DRAFT_621812 [Corynespora cassiicola Philippines]